MGTRQDPAGDTYAAAYDTWRRRLADSLDLDFDPVDPGGEAGDWLLTVYRENGDLPADRLGPLVHARRAGLAAAAVTALSRAFAADDRTDAAVPVRTEPPSPSVLMGRVQVGDQEIQRLDTQGVAVEAADGFQSYLADTQALVWPTCPAHRTGAHPRLVSGSGAWHCPAGNHVLGPILGPAAR